MNTYNLDKGENLDIDGRNLHNWINSQGSNIHNIVIKDTGAATITNMARMFDIIEEIEMEPEMIEYLPVSNIISIDISSMNTSKVTSMLFMFNNSTDLVNISNFDTSNVTNMRGMFISCRNLTSIPNFNTINVTDMWHMFQDCHNLTNVPNFNTSNVTNMRSMFYVCENLITVPNFNTSNVTNMRSMFSYCYSLTNVPEFNTSNVTDMVYMFSNCNSLSDASIQNIVNMCLNSNITNSALMNLHKTNSYSIFSETNISNTRYQNRWNELNAAGWTY